MLVFGQILRMYKMDDSLGFKIRQIKIFNSSKHTTSRSHLTYCYFIIKQSAVEAKMKSKNITEKEK